MQRVADWPLELLALLGVLAGLYGRTMPPGISSWELTEYDAPLMQTVGSSWGLAHSPGYPLYTILANLWVRLVGLVAPGTDPAWRVSLWSVATGLATIAVLYLIVRRLTGSRVAATGAAALLGVSRIFWETAIVAEVYSLNTLIFAATLWLALLWAERGDDRLLIPLGLVMGAGLVHHRTAFFLPPTVALWMALRGDGFRPTLTRVLKVAGWALVPYASYVYLPLVSRWRMGHTRLYGDASRWDFFWFMFLSREWWGLFQPPATLSAWAAGLSGLLRQQATQITALGVAGGLAGLVVLRRRAVLFALPLLALAVFAVSYHVSDVVTMLAPLTLLLAIGLGVLAGTVLRQARRGRWWVWAGLTLVVAVLLGLTANDLARANYRRVDQSGDWTAVDLLEELRVITEAGTPVTVIGLDFDPLSIFFYGKAVQRLPIEVLSTFALRDMPAGAGRAELADRFRSGRRVFIDWESLYLKHIGWLMDDVDAGRIFVAPTGHPYLWELLPRPLPDRLPTAEGVTVLSPPPRFAGGRAELAGYTERLIVKRTGHFLRVTLFWRALAGGMADYKIAVHPLADGERALAKEDHFGLMRGYLSTSQLVAGEVVRDEVDVPVRDAAGLADTQLQISFYQITDQGFVTFGQAVIPVGVGGSSY